MEISKKKLASLSVADLETLQKRYYTDKPDSEITAEHRYFNLAITVEIHNRFKWLLDPEAFDFRQWLLHSQQWYKLNHSTFYKVFDDCPVNIVFGCKGFGNEEKEVISAIAPKSQYEIFNTAFPPTTEQEAEFFFKQFRLL